MQIKGGMESFVFNMEANETTIIENLLKLRSSLPVEMCSLGSDRSERVAYPFLSPL